MVVALRWAFDIGQMMKEEEGKENGTADHEFQEQSMNEAVKRLSDAFERWTQTDPFMVRRPGQARTPQMWSSMVRDDTITPPRYRAAHA